MDLLADYKMKSSHFKENRIFFSLSVQVIVPFIRVEESYCSPPKFISSVFHKE